MAFGDHFDCSADHFDGGLIVNRVRRTWDVGRPSFGVGYSVSSSAWKAARSTTAGRLGALVAAAGGPGCFEISCMVLSFCRYNNVASIAGGEPHSLRDTVLHDND